jgi:hypothetical protein
MFQIKTIQGFISDFSQSGEFLSTYGKIIGEDSLLGTNCFEFTHRCVFIR